MRYLTVFFAQGDDADAWLSMLDERGPGVVMDALCVELGPFTPSIEEREAEYLARVEAQSVPDAPWGEEDRTYEEPGRDRILSWNSRVGYVGLHLRLSEIEGIFDNGGKTTDRYRVSLDDGGGYYVSDDVSPRGVFMYEDDAHGPIRPAEDEQEIGWKDLPWQVRRRLLMDYAIPPEE